MMSIVEEKSMHVLLAETSKFLLSKMEDGKRKRKRKKRNLPPPQNQKTLKLFIPMPLILIEPRCYKWHLDAI